jgi:integrase
MKRGKVYYFRFRDPITEQIGSAKSSGQTNKTLADAWALEEYARMVKVAGESTIPFGEWIDRFYKPGCPHLSTLYDKGRTISKTTILQNRGYIDDVIKGDRICRIRLCDLRRADINDLRDRIIALKSRTRTAQMIFSVVTIALNEAVLRGHLEVSPAFKIPKIAYKKNPRVALPFADIQEILKVEHWTDLTVWRLVKTAAYTGMRAGEAIGLLWQGVDNPKGYITIYNNRPAHMNINKAPKWGKTRVTIYPPIIQELLEPLREPQGYVFNKDSEPLTYNSVANALNRAGNKAKIRATLHQFRHSLQTYLRGRGVPDDLLRAAFGWSNANVQEGYTHRELYDLTPLENALK